MILKKHSKPQASIAMRGLLRKYRISFLLLFLSITACASPQKIPYFSFAGKRIGVIANFTNQALFQRVGTISVDNVSFYRRIPGLNINSLVIRTIVRKPNFTHKMVVIPIYRRTSPNLFAGEKSLTPQYKRYLRSLVDAKNLDYILLITPAYADFSEGQCFKDIWYVKGYGLFNSSFLFMSTNTVFVAYNMYFLDARTYRIWSNVQVFLKVSNHHNKVIWHKGYFGVSRTSLGMIKSAIQKNLPASLIKALHNLVVS